MSIVYQRERVAAARGELEQFKNAQWSEMAQGFGGVEVDIRWESYLAADNAGLAYLLTARDEGRMIGYFGAMIGQMRSAKATKVAASVPYYVEPRPNRGIVLRRLFKTAAVDMKAMGVSLFKITTHPWASAAVLLEAEDFKLIETSYMLKIEGPNA